MQRITEAIYRLFENVQLQIENADLRATNTQLQAVNTQLQARVADIHADNNYLERHILLNQDRDQIIRQDTMRAQNQAQELREALREENQLRDNVTRELIQTQTLSQARIIENISENIQARQFDIEEYTREKIELTKKQYELRMQLSNLEKKCSRIEAEYEQTKSENEVLKVKNETLKCNMQIKDLELQMQAQKSVTEDKSTATEDKSIETAQNAYTDDDNQAPNNQGIDNLEEMLGAE